MKSVRSKILSVVLIALFAIVTGITGTFFMNRTVNAAAQSETQTVSEDTAYVAPDEGSSYAAINRPTFYTGSLDENDDVKYTAVPGGAYNTAFTYSTTQSQYVQLKGYDPATMTYALSNTTYMTAVEDATAKTLTVTVKNGAPATTAAAPYKITVKLRPDETSGNVENTWGDLFQDDKVYEIAVNKLSIDTPTFWRVVKTTDESGTATTKEERVTGEYVSVPYSASEPYTFKVKGYNANLFTPSVSQNAVTYVVSADGTEVTVTYPAALTVGTTRYFRLTLKDTSSMEWKDGTGSTARDYTIIVEKKAVKAPSLVDADKNADHVKTLSYNGGAQTVKFSPAYSGELTFTMPSTVSGVTGSGSFDATTGVFNALFTKAATYTVTVSLADTAKYMWEDNATPNTVYTVVMNKGVIKDGAITLNYYAHDSGRTAVSKVITEVTGGGAEFSHTIEYETSDFYYSLVGVNDSMISVSGYSTSYYLRANGFDNATNRYNFFVDYSYNSSYTNPIGTHYFFITPTTDYAWENGTTGTKTVSITVNKRAIAVPKIISGEISTDVNVTASANGIRSNKDTEIDFLYDGTQKKAYLNNYVGTIIQYNSSSPSGNYFTEEAYQGSTHYYFYYTNQGTYTLYLKLSNTSYYQWEDAVTNTSATRTYVMRIVTKALDDLETYNLVTYGKDSSYASANRKPVTITQDGVNYRYVMEYPLTAQYFAIEELQGNYLTVNVSNASILGARTWANDNTEYRFDVTTSATVASHWISFVPKTGYGWSDGKNDTRYLYIQVKKHIVDFPSISNGVWLDGENYRDYAGNIVTDVTGKGIISKINNVDYYNKITYEYNHGNNVFLYLPYVVEDGIQLYIQNDGFRNNGSYSISNFDTNSGGNGVIRFWYHALQTGSNLAYLRIRLPDTNRYQWPDGSTGVVAYYLEITARKLTGDFELLYFGSDSNRSDLNKQVVVNKTQNSKDLNYTYHTPYSDTAQYFAVTDFVGYVSFAVNHTTYIDNQGIDTTRKYAMFYIKGGQNPYTCVYTITPSSNYCWEDGATGGRSVTVVVDKIKVEAPKLATPEEDTYDLATVDSTTTKDTTVVTYTYDGATHPIYVSGYQGTAIITATFSTGAVGGVTGSGHSISNNAAGISVGQYYWYAKNVGMYTYTFSLANTNRYEWDDAAEGGSASRVFRLQINKKKINEVTHPLNYYGSDTGFSVNNKQQVMDTVLSAGLSYSTYYTSNYYYCFTLDGLYDVNLKENLVSVAIPANTPINYNSNYMINVGANATTGEWRFRIDQYHATSYGSIIRQCLIQFTPTNNYCWDDGATNETRNVYISIIKRPVDVPELNSLIGDETNEDGEVENSYGATYNATTRTAYYTYQEGADLGMYIGGYSAFITRTASADSTVKNENNGYTFTAAKVNTYTLTMTVSNTTFYEWNDDVKTGSRVFTIIISKAKVAIPTLIYTDDAYGTAEKTGATITDGYNAVVEFRAKNHYFNILGYDNTRMAAPTLSNPNSMAGGWKYDSDYNGYVIYLTQGSGNNRVGKVTFTVSPDANHEWDVKDGSEGSARQFIIEVKKARITLPEFEFADAGSGGFTKTLTYNGTQQTATLLNASQDYFTVTKSGSSANGDEWQVAAKKYLLKVTNAGTYTLTLAPVGNYEWDDATATGNRIYTVIVERMELEAPKLAYYGADATYAAGSRVTDSDVGFIRVNYNPNIPQSGSYYFTFEGYSHITSAYFDISTSNNTNYMTTAFDDANSRIKLSVIHYSTDLTRTAGWTFYLTPKANYCWKTASSTVDFAQKSFVVYVDKLEIALPTVYVEDGDNFANNYKTVTYNGQNQRISFLNFANSGITHTLSHSTMTVDWTTEAFGEEQPDGSKAKVSVRNFYAKNAADYSITLSISNTSYYKWENNATNPVYHLVIDRQEVEIPKFYRLDSSDAPITDPDDPDYIHQDTRQAYVSYSTLTGYKFVLQNYAGGTYYSASVSEATLKTALTGTDYFLTLAAGVNRKDYTLTVTPNSNYKWKGEGYDAKVYTITVQQVKVSLISLYDPIKGEVIEGNRYTAVYNATNQNIVFMPTISAVNNNHFNYSTDVIAVYNTYAGNESYRLTPSAGSKITIDGVTVDSSYMAQSTVGTYDYRVRLISDNYVWDNGNSWNTYRQYIFVIAPKEIPRLEYYYNDVKYDNNTVTDEYSRTTRAVYCVVPEGSTADLNEYSVSLRNTSYFSAVQQSTYDGRPAFLVRVAAFAPADYYFTITTINGNIMWTGEGVRTASEYHFVVTKATLAEPVFNLIESAATDDDPTAMKDTPIESGHTVEYTGNYYRIKFTGAHSSEVSIGGVSGAPALSDASSTGASWSNATMECIRTAVNANTYTVRVSVRDTNLYQWAGGLTYRDYTFIISRKQVTAPVYTFTGGAYNSSDVQVVDGDTYSTVFNNANQFFKLSVEETAAISSFDTGTSNSSYRLTADSSQWAASKYYYFYQRYVANYTVKVNLSSNYCWIGGSTDPLTYRFNITRMSVAAPEFDEDWLINNGFTYTLNGDTLSVVYCNKGVTAHIKGYDTNLMKNDYWWYPNNNQNYSGYRPTTNSTDQWIAFNANCSWVNNASYPYKIQIDLKDTVNYQWVGGGTSALIYNMHIIKQDVVAPNMYQVTVQNGEEGDYEVETLISTSQLEVTYDVNGYDVRIKDVNKDQVTFALSAVNWNGGSISGVNLAWADGSTEGNYHLVTAGTYTIYVRLRNTSYFQWAGSTNTDQRVYTVIINRQEISLPTLEDGVTQTDGSFKKSVVYDGNAQPLKILTNYDLTRTGGTNFSDLGDPDRTVAGCITYPGAVHVGTYSVILGFNGTGNANLNFIYANGTQTQTFTLEITPKPIAVPYIINGDGLEDNGTVDGTRKTVIYTADTAGRSMLVRGYNATEMTYSWNGTTMSTYTDEALNELILKATAQNAASYSLTFSLTNDYMWQTTGGVDRAAKTLTLQITQKVVSAPTPYITANADYISTVENGATRKDINLTFNGEQQGFTVTFAENVELGVGISGTVTHTVVDASQNLHSYTALNATSYWVRFYIYNTTNYKWADGLSDTYRYIYIIIKPKTVSIPTIVANDEYDDNTSRWTGSYKYVDYNTGNRYIVIDGYDSNLMNYSKTSSLNLLATTTPAPAEGEGGDAETTTPTTPAKNYLTFYAVAVNTYTVTFTLSHSSNYIWETGNTNGQSLYLVINKKAVTVPTIEGVNGNTKEVVFNGANQSMVLSPWDANEVLMYDKTGTLQVSSTNPNEFLAMNYLNNTGYMVRVRLTNYSNYRWADNGADDRYYYLKITPQAVDLPTIVEEDDKATATYDHAKGIKTVTFNTYSQSIKVSVPYGKVKYPTYPSGMSLKDDSKWATSNELEYQATNATTYTIYFYLDSANYKWKDDVAYNNAKSLQFVINKIKVNRPAIVVEDLGDNGTIVGNQKTVEYTAYAQYMNIYAPFEFVSLTTYNSPGRDTDDNWKKNDTLNVWATNVNTYTFRFNLKNTGNMEWDNQTNGSVDMILKIDIKRLLMPAIEGYGSNMTQTVSYETDANGNPVTQYMYLTNIVDEHILTVSSYTSYSNTSYGTYRLNYVYDAENQRYVCSANDVFYTTGVNNYSITIHLANTNYRWTDGTTTDKTYNLRIERKAIDLPAYYEVSAGKDDDGKDIEILSPVNSGKAIFEYDGNDKKVRLTGVLNNIINYSDNSIASSSNGNKNGDLLESYDPKTGTLNYAASHVYLNYYSNTIDYQITLSLKNTKNYVWNDGNNGTGYKYFYVRINRKQITLPRIEGNTGTNMYYLDVPFNNQPQSFTLSGVDQNWMTATSYNTTTFPIEYKDGNKLVGDAEKDVRDNYVTLALKDTLNTSWTTSSSYDVGNKAYHLRIQVVKMILPSVVGNNTQKYTSDKYTFQYRDVWDSDYMTYTLNDIKNMSADYDADTKILTVTVAANAPITSYYVTFVLKNYNNMQWNTSYATSNKSVYIYLQKAQVTIPSIVDNGTSLKKSVTYSGKDQKIALKDYLRDVNADGTAKWMSYTLTSGPKFNGGAGVWNAKDETMEFSAQNVATYVVRVSTNAFCTFTDGSTYKDFTLEITKAIYDSPFFVDDGVGTTTATVKTFTFNFTVQNAVMSNVINDVNITDQIVWWRDITSYSNGTASDHRLQIKWDKDSNSATIGAEYIGTYWIRFQIADNAWANARWSTTTSNYIDYRIVINRAVLTVPTVVKTGLATNESISGRYKYSVYNGSFIVAQFKDIDATYLTWKDLTNYAGKDDDHKAVFTYDDDTKVLTLKAKYVATYTFRVYLKDINNTNWSGYSAGYNYTFDLGLVINKFNHAYPTVASGVSTSVTYTGTDINFTLQNVVQGTDRYEVTLGSMKEVSWDQGLLTLSAKDVGTYTVKVSIIDTDNSSWTSYTSRTFNFVINKKALSAELKFSSPVTEVNDAIDQGSNNWAAGVPVFLNVAITGLNPVEGETVGINAYWYNNNNSAVTTALTASGTNRYAIPTTLTKGTYYVVITHAAAADNYTLGTYKLKFVINSDPAKFTENDLVWQYSIGGNSKIQVTGSHNTPGTALDLTYAGAAYQFSITLNDIELQKLNVRLVSYSGDTTATDYKADTYCVSVVIGAYDSSYYFPQTTYHLYYTIAKAKFNMSQVKWDYSDPYTYDETAKSVEILGTSLPAGLTVASYTGNTSETNATEGKARGYTTGVTFTVSSQNYITPLQSDPSTYTGDFSWTCDWQINKAPIDVQWKPIVKVDEDNMIFNIPVLIDGGEKVTYSYEKWIEDDSYDEGGYWKQTEKVTYSQVEVTYRVTPKLTDGTFSTVNYATNYKLVPFEDQGTVAHEFTVGGSQIPVMFKVLVNGKTGTQFPYTGSAYVATISVDQDDEGRISVVDNSVKVTYTRLSDGTNMGSTAPVAVGKYKVVITLNYNIKDAGDSSSISSKVEDEFEIIKGTIDTSMLVWKIDHTGGVGKCTYDAAQGKWIDIYGAEVSKFVYDGNPYKLTLEGTDKLYGLTISGYSGLEATNKGDYQAKFIMTYDANSWEAPDFPNTLDWSISVAEIVLNTAYWNYANAFVYTLEDGSAVTRTVELQSLPKQLTDMVTAGTATVTYTGNSGSLAGTYTAKVTINVTNPNYTVVFPETLKDTLTWTIEQRKLTIPEESGQWTEFDGKSHDIMVEVCGADADWADFYDVSIRYSRDGSTYMNYSGYKDVLTDAYDAWFYELTLTIKSSINTKNATNAVWENESSDKQVVRFSVGKLTVTVTGWKGDYENTTAMTDYDAIVQPDMLGYTITDADGKEYTKDEAKLLGGGITLTVKPYVVSALTNNITLAYVDDNSKSYDYVTPYTGLEWLVNPELKADTADYDGTKHTFVIDNWEYYSDYLEFTSITDDEGKKIESASLEQTKAGTYSVYLKIKDTANASWKTTDGTIDRSKIIELTFTINAKMITIPTISDYEYTGSAINLATVLDKSFTDFVELSGNVSATNVGKYELKLKFKDADSCVWNDGSSDEKSINWNVNQRVLSTPDAGGWTVFDGEVHNLVKDCGYGDDWNTYFDVTVEYSADGSEFETFEGYETDKNYTAYKSGVYKIVFTIKSALNNGNENVVWSNFSTEAQTATVAVSNYSVTVTGWNANKEQSTVKLSDGSTASTKFFEYILRNSETNAIVTVEEVLTAGVGKGFTIELAVKSSYTDFVSIIYSNDSYKTYFFSTEKISIDKPEFRFSSYEFNATERTFEIVDWATKYNKYLEMDHPAEYLKQTNAGNYSVILSFKSNSVAAWADGSSDAYTLNFSITVKEIVKPALANAAYTGSEINILTQYIAEYGDDYIEIKSGDKYTDAGNYKLVLGLKYPESTKWQGGDNSDLTVNWSITQTKLVAPADSEKWTVFDAANHNLLELCNVQTNWNNYYTAKIEYSADGVTYSDFSGNVGYNAGSYKLTFHIKDDLNPDGASNVVWASTENTDDVEVVITVAKLEVKVIGWNEKANDSTVKLESGSLPASVTSYIFKDADGKEVTEAEVLASAQGVKFSKELVISDTDNVKVEYETAGLKRYYFVMSVHKMYIPQLSETSVEYDGKLHTFLINDWDLYTKYVEITADSDSLSQQDAKTYTIKLHIKDAMVSTWQDGSTDDVTLTFEITQIIVDGRWDTKNMPNTFVVTGTYPVENNSLVNVTYTDKDGKTADPTNLKEGETYTATVALNRSYTTNYKLDENIELTSVFTMPINYTRLNLPTIKDATRPYNGKAQTFQIGYWATTYVDYLEMEGSLTQTDTGKYEVTLTFKEGVHATWQDGSIDPVTLKFEITGVTVKATWDITGDAPVLDTSATDYAGGKLPEKLISYVFKDDKGNVAEAKDLVSDTTYYVTASISADYRLNFTFASDVQKVYVFFIRDGKIEPAQLKKLEKPTLLSDSKEYTGAELTFEIENWDTVYKTYLDIVDGSLKQTDADEYSITLRFKDGVAAIWSSGGMEDVVLKFTVTQRVLNGEWIFEEEGLEQPYFDLAEEGFELPEGLLEYVIKDADGKVVTAIKANVTYYITVSTTDVNYKFANGIETEKVFRLNTDNTLTEVVVKRMALPEFVQASIVYDGTAHEFEIVDFDEISSFVEVTGDNLTQTNVGKYKVTFHIKDTTVSTWVGGTTGDYSIYFEITSRTTALPVAMPSMADEKLVYTGSEITFAIANWAESYQDIIELSGDDLTQTIVGEYSVTLKIKDTSLFIWENGKLEDVTLKFEIVKAQVEGEWLLGDDVPYFAPDETTFGAYPEDMIEYTITDKDGNVIDFKDTQTCVTYYMKATIVNDNFEFAEGVQTTFAFRYTEGNVLFAVVVQLLDMPEFVQSSIEYDGEEHTFEVKDWAFLGQYLELSGASLTQTDVGEYSATFTITDTTLATWQNGTTRTVSIRFEITERTSGNTELELPAMETAEYTYDGTEHTFAIKGWADLADKVELSGDSLTQTEVGTYTATLRIKNSVLYVWADGTDTATVTFEVKAILVDAQWVYNDIDVPYLEDVSLDIVRYEVTDVNGNVVDAYNAVEGVNYYITAYITDYNYTFADGLETRFVYRLDSEGDIIPVEKTTIGEIKFVESSIEYDGEAHTFEIVDWDYLSIYFDITGSKLTQTRVGKYSVTLIIIDTTLATFENSSSRSLTLRFEITERTSETVELALPVIETTEYTYDGTEHTFVIENWADLEGKVELEGDSLIQTEVGTYTATLRIKNSILYVWADGSNTVTVSFTIKAIPLKAEWIFSNTDVPYISFLTSTAVGYSVRNDIAVHAEEMVRYEITDYYGNVINEDDTVSGVNYYITAIITDPNYAFEEGFENRFVYRISTDGEIIPVPRTTINEVKFVADTITYDGEAHTFEIADWNALEPYIQVIGSLTKTEIGEYKVTIHIIDKTLATWENGTALDKTILFHIIEDALNVSFEHPIIEIESKEFNGTAQTFQISNWDELKKYVKIKEGLDALTQTDVGTYTITLQIESERFTWKTDSEEDSTADFVLKFKIGKRKLAGTWDRFNHVPKLVLSGEDLPEDMLVAEITDRNGLAVEIEALEVGETYLVTYSVSEQYDESYTLPVSMRAQHFRVVTDGNTDLLDGFPAEQEREEADNTLTKIVFAVVIILVLFLVTIIICFVYIIIARKKKAKQDAEKEQAENSEDEGSEEDEGMDEDANSYGTPN
ncbi:MAG: hypothetical protein K2L12_03605 [Clostridia bacterium]|nr:hypothetical protein [Clostridia bacterium]